MAIANDYDNLASQLSKAIPNSNNFSTGELPQSQVEYEEFVQQISRTAAAYSALALNLDSGGRSFLALGLGLQIIIAHDNIQAAPPNSKISSEVKEYGGVIFGAAGGIAGAALISRAPVVGAIVGDLVVMSLWKAGVDYFEPQLAPHNVNVRNSF